MKRYAVLIILLVPLFVFAQEKKKKTVSKWGLVGYREEFVTDETEILVQEWLEFLFYNQYGNFPSYIEKIDLNANQLTKKEKRNLLSYNIDTTLFPIKEFFDFYPTSYIFFRSNNATLYRTHGLFGHIFIPINSDSINNKESKQRIDDFLETPISGITYEQAISFCRWRTKVDSAKYYSRHSRSIDELNSFNEIIGVFVYSLPTKEQFAIINHQFDSITPGSKYLSNFNYKNSSYSAKKKYKFENRGCGKMPINGFSFNHYPKTFSGYWTKNTQGNVAEMTIIKGEAVGGSFFHYARESYNNNVNKYTKPEIWLGFRCVGILRKE